MPKDLPDDPALLKQLLEQMLLERESNKGRIVHLEEENALLRQGLLGRKSEQTADPATPQLALFNEAESVTEAIAEGSEEEVAAPAKRHGKRKPLPADLPRIEVIHELPEHELTCVCGWGRRTLRAANVPAEPEWAMRRELLSGSFTTRLDQLLTIKAN